MFWQALLSVRDVGRLYDIAATLVRYGFGDMVRRAGLADTLERAGRALHWPDATEFAHLPPAARVRRALEELGPTFVKLGQVLASRVDLLDAEWIAEFSHLHDGSLAVPFEQVGAQMVEDLGCEPHEAFAAFEPVPVATGSLAQVYRARLHDGTAVVVKVRRPAIRTIVEADLRLLARLAQLAEAEVESLRAFQPQQMVREFTQSLHREMDFASEARNGRRVAQNFEGYTDADASGTGPVIVVPAICWESERLCVQEEVAGIPGTRLAEVDAAGLDRRLLARRGARAVLKMIVADGFYHADPHPGNVFYLEGNRIAFIDFGMVGRLTEQRREQLVRLLLGLVRHEAPAVADVLAEWTGDAAVAQERLLVDIENFVDQYRGLPLRQLHLGEMLNEVARILRDHRLVLPGDLALLIKAFITLEGMGRELDPDFDMAGEALPALELALREHYAPDAVLKRGWQSVRQVASLLGDLPRDLSRLLRAARAGRLDVKVEVPQLGQAGNQPDRAASRLSMSIVIAALIIGSSIVMTVPGGPSLVGLPFFGLLGFLGAVAGSLWLLVSIHRSGREGKR